MSSSYLSPIPGRIRMRWYRGRYVPASAAVAALGALTAKQIYTARIIARTVEALYAQGGIFNHKPGGFIMTNRDFRRTVLSLYYDAKGSIANVWS